MELHKNVSNLRRCCVVPFFVLSLKFFCFVFMRKCYCCGRKESSFIMVLRVTGQREKRKHLERQFSRQLLCGWYSFSRLGCYGDDLESEYRAFRTHALVVTSDFMGMIKTKHLYIFVLRTHQHQHISSQCPWPLTSWRAIEGDVSPRWWIASSCGGISNHNVPFFR